MRHEKAKTLLDLAQHLAANAEGLTLDEMAVAMHVGRRTAERMRDALETLFPQMEAMADGPSKRFRIPGGLGSFFHSPTTEELLELGKASAHLHATGAESRAKTLESLERKIRSAMNARARRRLDADVEALVRAETIAVQAGPRPFEDEVVIGAVRAAIVAMRALSFRYMGGARPGLLRTVTPYGLMFGRANYLVATETGKPEPMNWRLDRLQDIEVLERHAAPPKDFSLKDYANRSFGVFQGEVEEVVLKILPGDLDALGWRFHPSQTTEAQPDGSVIVRFRASGMRELAWHLFTWRDQARILSPSSLKAEMLAELERALACHRDEPAA